ncbi:hypothetical protein CRG98_050474 [Punica granatum]|uniref:Uncharacterized protein n=1 Tax=Punica granatum TaxID=22663 RepID=A0A2I0GBJ1_PUNGR|nr:hypothetical protein CRG98_050474 [Punica granatum]
MGDFPSYFKEDGSCLELQVIMETYRLIPRNSVLGKRITSQGPYIEARQIRTQVTRPGPIDYLAHVQVHGPQCGATQRRRSSS